MKVLRNISVLFVLVVFMAGCASFGAYMADLQSKWNKLTPNEKALIVVGGFQDQLSTLFATGKSYVAANPAKTEEWKTSVVPAFDTANRALKNYIILIGQGKCTPELVFKEIPPLVQSVITLLQAMGVKIE